MMSSALLFFSLSWTCFGPFFFDERVRPKCRGARVWLSLAIRWHPPSAPKTVSSSIVLYDLDGGLGATSVVREKVLRLSYTTIIVERGVCG